MSNVRSFLLSLVVLASAASEHVSAVVALLSKNGARYLGCVERLADRDIPFRGELLRAISQDKASGTRFALPWTITSRNRLVAACGRAPAYQIDNDVLPDRQDHRPPEVIAQTLASWSRRIVQIKGGRLIWISKQQARLADKKNIC